ncbi:MAG: glycoside hydrolase family 3 N-terminal domain-containing protein, partial [Nitrospirota bacterium]
MKLEQKIGQMIIAGFDGYEPSDGVLRLISGYGLGGVILFNRNLKDYPQILNLCSDIQGRSTDCPLFISVDQEGGRVTRLPPPFTKFPP